MRLLQGDELRQQPAERHARKVRAFDARSVENAHGIIGQILHRVGHLSRFPGTSTAR